MDRELDILQLADYYKLIEYKSARAYLIVNKKMGDYRCMFGFVDMPNDMDVASGLFYQLELEAKEQGYNYIVGPINYCTYMNYRWALSNFEHKIFPDCDNPEYYVDFIKNIGYEELYTYRSARIKISKALYIIGKMIYEEKLREGYEFKIFEDEHIYENARDVYDISVKAFRNSALYSDIPYEYFEKIYLQWTKLIQAGLIMVYYKNEPIAYGYGYDNIYNSNFICKTVAVKDEYRNKNVYVALMYLACKYMKDKGHRDMIFHFQCEQNDGFRKFRKGMESDEKRYAVFIKRW